MLEQTKYFIQVWDQIGILCEQQWVRTKDQALGLARSTAQKNSYTTTVYFEGTVIARFDNRPAVSG